MDVSRCTIALFYGHASHYTFTLYDVPGRDKAALANRT